MESSKSQITARVIEIACEQVGADPATVTPATHFVNDLNFDSLDKVEFAMELEDEFEFSVPDEDAERFDTIASVVDYLSAGEARTMQDQKPAAAN